MSIDFDLCFFFDLVLLLRSIVVISDAALSLAMQRCPRVFAW